MSRIVSFGLVGLLVASFSSIGYAQCLGVGYFSGGYTPSYRGYSGQHPVYGGRCTQQRLFFAQPNNSCNQWPHYSIPQYPSRGNVTPNYEYEGTYSSPQGSGSRGIMPAPNYPGQPVFQPGPSYSAPQGSGSRSYPSQGSGSR